MISLSNDDDRFAALQRRDSELDELIAEVREGTGDGRRLSMETLHRLADEFEGKTPGG